MRSASGSMGRSADAGRGPRGGPLRHRWLRAVALTALGTLCVGCLPGGMLVPLPVPHVRRPAVEGTVLDAQGPVQGLRVAVVAFVDHPPATCAGGASARTDAAGRFVTEADRALVRLWWSDRDHGLGLCLPEHGDALLWSTPLHRSEFTHLPARVRIDCRLGPAGDGRCTVLRDEIGVDARSRMPGGAPASA